MNVGDTVYFINRFAGCEGRSIDCNSWHILQFLEGTVVFPEYKDHDTFFYVLVKLPNNVVRRVPLKWIYKDKEKLLKDIKKLYEKEKEKADADFDTTLKVIQQFEQNLI